ncbi:prenyltransferase/squalene oxidase repeat-containing protein [Streptomyces sp. N35]|uniref:prenyltransferase/squalene oxidase repeat-containing protein n=1 Tax=Streptomyces sp. N35 TaxID=2795730 RepID=UPI0018F52C7F|nr:prenyltransferase/squalene oxidase repeat-containing protein [Streptomyces sp. N35]
MKPHTSSPPLPLADPAPERATDPRLVHRRASERLLSLQNADGSWEGEMVWNTTTLSQYVITRHLLGRPNSAAEAASIIRHYAVTRRDRHGWGLHAAADTPSLYCTTLAYTALRLLGLPADHPLCAPARIWLRSQPGGVAAVPSWGKFWLALLGLYDYRAMHPVSPELFVLPRWLPLHPDRLYCHTRSIMQAMSYLYGVRFRGPSGLVIDELRAELFDRRLRARDRYRTGADTVAAPTPALRVMQAALGVYELRPSRALRRRALERCRRRVEHEHTVTARTALSPANGLLDVLVLHACGADPQEIDASLDAFDYWRWSDAGEGTRYVGARSHTWDTAFAVEALLADRSPGPPVIRATTQASRFLASAQIVDEIPEPHLTARSPALGGWCFSAGRDRWPVSDCTAEAVGALFTAAFHRGVTDSDAGFDVPAATEFLLARQNRDGGFGTYEERRGPRLLERLNPAEMFTNCTIESSYIECTGSAAVALAQLRQRCAGTQRQACDRGLRRAAAFLLSQQSKDGSWPAAWGVNRIYGTLFAVRGLLAAGVPRTHASFVKAGCWLESVQRPDGGWAEHHSGCLEERYVPGDHSQPLSTAWALLVLLELTGGRSPAVTRGIDWLCTHQRPDGSWQQDAPMGVFFGSAVLDYRYYREYFPLWAVGRWLSTQPAPATGRTQAHT